MTDQDPGEEMGREQTPEEAKQYEWNKKILEQYKYLFDWFMTCAIKEDFPKDISISWYWNDLRLHIKYKDHSKHRPY